MKASIRFPLALAALLHSALSPLSLGQDEPTPGDDVYTLSPFEIVGSDEGYRASNAISATRINMPIKDLPFSMNVLTENFMEDAMGSSFEIEEAMRFVPGANQQNFNTGIFSIRGFDTGALKRDGFDFEPQLNRTDAIYLDRIEVLKGPQSTLFGLGTPSGVVNMITKKPKSVSEHSVTARYGSWDSVRIEADSTGPIAEDTLSYRVIGMLDNREFFDEGEFIDRKFAMASLRWTPSGQTIVDGGFLYQDDDYRERTSIPRVRDSANGRAFFLEVPHSYSLTAESGGFVSAYEEQSAWIKATHTFSENLSARTIASGYEIDQDVKRRFNGGNITPDSDSTRFIDRRRRFTDEAFQWQTDVTANYDFGFGSVQLLGGFLLQDLEESGALTHQVRNDRRLDPVSNFPIAGQDAVADPRIWAEPVVEWSDPGFINRGLSQNSEEETSAIYTVNQVKLLEDRLLLFAGYRSADVDLTTIPIQIREDGSLGREAPSVQDFTFDDWQAGASLRATKDITVYASFSTSSLPNVNFPTRPQEGEGWDVGVKFDVLAGKLSGNIAYFDIELTNIEQFDTSRQDNPFILSGGQESDGIEVELFYTPLESWELIFSYAHIDGQVFDDVNPAVIGRELQGTPDNAFNLWTRYDFDNGFSIGGGINYRDEARPFPPSSGNYDFVAASYTRLDLFARYEREISENVLWHLQINLQNATDESFTGNRDRYEPPANVTLSSGLAF